VQVGKPTRRIGLLTWRIAFVTVQVGKLTWRMTNLTWRIAFATVRVGKPTRRITNMIWRIAFAADWDGKGNGKSEGGVEEDFDEVRRLRVSFYIWWDSRNRIETSQ